MNAVLTKKVFHKKKKDKFGIFDVCNYTFMILLAFICLFPVLYEILLSFSSRADYLSAKLLVIPRDFNIESYKFIFGQGRVLKALGISLLITVGGTVYSMILTCFGAYAFTRKHVPGLKILFTIIIFTMFFGGGVIPFFLVVKDVVGINNLWCLVLPFGINSFNLIIMRNFFNQVPYELIESAKLDGASDFRILFQIVIPLSKAGLATIVLWYVISYWDAWYWASFFLSKRTDLYPLALELRNLLQGIDGSNPVDPNFGVDGSKLFDQGRQAATIVVSIFPILVFYPFLQKYFVKGQMFGAVKG